MSRPAGPSEDVVYVPVPKQAGEETWHHQTPPPSPGPASGTPIFHAPSQDISLNDSPSSFPMFQLPPGAGAPLPSGVGMPRFLGASGRSWSDGGIRDSYASSSHTSGYRYDPSDAGSTVEFPVNTDKKFGKHPNRRRSEKIQAYTSPRQKQSRRKIWGLVALGVILIAAALGVGLYFGLFKKSANGTSSDTSGNSGSGSGSSPGSGEAPAQVPQRLVSGGDGSIVTFEDGTNHTYTNAFGGTWYYDERDPFNNNAQAQFWTTPLNSTFNYGPETIRGVNIGGWLVLEPFISPALFQKYGGNNPAIDEWTLSQKMRADKSATGGISQIEDHYKTFITEQDFADIAAAGLNYVRIPLGWWAIETRDNEPHLAKTSWTYFLKAVKWARKYGIRINLDFHAVPGSQNGWNHSGKFGSINMLLGPMGYANAQRTLDYTRIIAEFISQPEYSSVVTMFSILNEPHLAQSNNEDNYRRYYYEAYKQVRRASGTGTGKGPFITFHEGFKGLDHWVGFLNNADRIALDQHPYFCFGGQSSEPISVWKKRPCEYWGSQLNNSMRSFGLSMAGEWSLATTDCGLFLNNVGSGTRFEGTDPYESAGFTGKCSDWTNWQKWSPSLKQDYMNLAYHSMDALQNWFFWTWKIGNSSVSNTVETPHWSYQLGLQNGWMPTDPRVAVGQCGYSNPWGGQFKSWQTGGGNAGKLSPDATAGLNWPPQNIINGGDVDSLPKYTPTGVVPTLPGPTFAESLTATATGNGWANPSDTGLAYVPIAGCKYLDPWVGDGAPPPVCDGGNNRRRAARPVPAPLITSPPR